MPAQVPVYIKILTDARSVSEGFRGVVGNLDKLNQAFANVVEAQRQAFEGDKKASLLTDGVVKLTNALKELNETAALTGPALQQAFANLKLPKPSELKRSVRAALEQSAAGGEGEAGQNEASLRRQLKFTSTVAQKQSEQLRKGLERGKADVRKILEEETEERAKNLEQARTLRQNFSNYLKKSLEREKAAEKVAREQQIAEEKAAINSRLQAYFQFLQAKDRAEQQADKSREALKKQIANQAYNYMKRTEAQRAALAKEVAAAKRAAEQELEARKKQINEEALLIQRQSVMRDRALKQSEEQAKKTSAAELAAKKKALNDSLQLHFKNLEIQKRLDENRIAAEKKALADSLKTSTGRDQFAQFARTSRATIIRGFQDIGSEIQAQFGSARGSLLGNFTSTLTAMVGAVNESAASAVSSLGSVGDAADLLSKKTLLAKSAAQALAGGLQVGLGAILLALSATVTKTAGEFEFMNVKLVTVLKSQAAATRTLENAFKIAAATPFDVKEAANAAVTIESFGQSSQKWLPLVASLATSMNKSIEETALVVGKAASGSLEGFEALRNTYGISTAKIKEFGGAVDKTGRLLVQLPGQLAKNRDALQQIIQLNFGRALAQSANSLFTILSNIKDQFIKFAKTLGEGLFPIVKFFSQAVLDLVTLLNKIPATLVHVGAITVASVGFFNLLAGTAQILTSVLGILSATAGTTAGSLQAMSFTAGEAAASFNIAAASTRTFGLTITAMGGAMALIAVVATAAAVATTMYQQEVEKLNNSVEEQADTLRFSARSVRQLSDVFQEGLGVAMTPTRDAAEFSKRMDEINEKLKSGKGQADLYAAAIKNGFKLEDFEKELAERQRQRDAIDEQIKLMNQLFVAERRTAAQRAGFVLGSTNNTKEATERYNNALKRTVLDADSFTAAQLSIAQSLGIVGLSLTDAQATVEKMLGFQKQQAEQNIEELTVLRDTMQSVGADVEAAVSRASSFQQAFRFANSIKDLQVLDTLINQNAESLADLEAVFARRIGTPSIQEALAVFTDPGKEALRPLAQAYLEAQDQRIDLFRKEKELTAASVKDRVDAVKFLTDYETSSLGKADLKKERTALDTQARILKGSSDMVKKLYTEQLDLQRRLGEGASGEERDRINERLQRIQVTIAAYSSLAAAELENTRAIVKNQEQQVTEAQNKFKDNTARTVDDMKTKMDEFAKSGEKFTAPLRLQALNEGSAQFEKMVAAADPLIRKTKEFQDYVEKTRNSISRMREEVEKAGRKENLDALKLELQDMNNETESLEQKAKNIVAFIAATYAEQARGAISAKDAEVARVQASKDLLAIQRQITETQKQQVAELEGIRQSSIEQQKEILKLDLESARTLEEKKNIQRKIQAADDQILESKLLQLDAQRQKELDNAEKTGASKLLIEEKYRRLSENLFRDETIKQRQEQKNRTKDLEDEVKRRLDILRGMRENALGGPASPLKSIEQIALESTLPDTAVQFGERFIRPFASDEQKLTPQLFESRFRGRTGFKSPFDVNANLGQPFNPFEQLNPVAQPSYHTTNNITINAKRVQDDAELNASAQRMIKRAFELESIDEYAVGPAAPKIPKPQRTK